MQKLGQNFLKNQNVLRKIVAALEIKPKDTVIEIGPGHGELTEELGYGLQLAGGSKLIAIEKDRELAVKLTEKFKDDSRVEVVEGDVLKLLPSVTYNLKPKTYKLAGNVPYYITGFLLRTIGELDKKPDLIVLMLQKEVAERLTAQPKRIHPVRGREGPQREPTSNGMNRLAASVGFWAEPKILFTVPKGSFSPPPQVDSAVIQLKTKNEKVKSGDAEAYYKLVRALFKQPRKTIWNNLRDAGLKYVDKALQDAGINPQDRPQNLTIQNILDLAETIKNSA